ncbi:hypothetical protein [Paraburkholderia rhizosphaerae]|uniref:Uncharacterized protein n=1 Tax=Paraburkholderia rhizosphaerae TaxID=480658 RepID=A0A4R8LVQ1_9BURK|nr:hypothetical protein [Paraburkholderia rhizosphaerae]TDY50915.1 hypothetical protein BX592_108152 [Paraburkholderia rhizosphaerae]
MNFLRGVLARARGEAARVRPRRDYRVRAGSVEPRMEVLETEAVAVRAETPRVDEPTAHRPAQPTQDEPVPVRASQPATSAAQPAPAPAQPGIATHREASRATPQPLSAPAPAPAARQARVAPPLPKAHPQLPRAPYEQNAQPRVATELPLQTRVDIHIGKLEIVPPATTRTTPSPTPARTKTTPLTLAEYLTRRSERR